MRRQKLKANRKGMVLPFVLAIGFILAILGVGMLKLGYSGRITAAMSTSGISARAAADAGIADALYKMNELFVPNQPVSLPPDVENQTLANSNATYSYNITPPPAGAYPRYWLITSTGRVGRQQKRVYANTSIRNLFDYAVLVREAIDLREDAFVDGYDTKLGDYGPGNRSEDLPDLPDVKIGTFYAGPEQRIFLKNYVEVIGHVLVGVGGNVEEIILELGTPGPTTGPQYPGALEWIWDVDMPVWGPSLGNLNDPNFTIGDPNFTEVNVRYDNISIPNSGVLRIVGNVNLRIDGTLDLNNSAQLIVEDDPWSSVTIFLYGDLNVGQGALINNQTRKPRNFRLFGVGPSDAGVRWIINNSGNYHGMYLGPYVSINVRQSAVFYGSILGNDFTMAQSGQVHYDVDLALYSEYDVGFGIDRWWEEVLPLSAP